MIRFVPRFSQTQEVSFRESVIDQVKNWVIDQVKNWVIDQVKIIIRKSFIGDIHFIMSVFIATTSKISNFVFISLF